MRVLVTSLFLGLAAAYPPAEAQETTRTFTQGFICTGFHRPNNWAWTELAIRNINGSSAVVMRVLTLQLYDPAGRSLARYSPLLGWPAGFNPTVTSTGRSRARTRDIFSTQDPGDLTLTLRLQTVVPIDLVAAKQFNLPIVDSTIRVESGGPVPGLDSGRCVEGYVP